jgi:hypothetical protein
MVPGFGDALAVVFNPIQRQICNSEGEMKMPDILKPDMKSLAWLAFGAFVVPMILRKVR